MAYHDAAEHIADWRGEESVKSLSPRNANSFDKVCLLNRDNKTVGDCWILTDGSQVSIVQQNLGEAPRQEISIPRAQFNRLIAWYLKEQKLS